MWLDLLTPVRWFTIIGTTVLSALAGATILGAPGLLHQSFPTFAGICALGATVLSTLHTALHCDAHQAECRKQINLYAALEAGFQALRILPQSQMSTRLQELEKEFEMAVKAATASPPARFRVRAMKEKN
jgi:hypothetical protein